MANAKMEASNEKSSELKLESHKMHKQSHRQKKETCFQAAPKRAVMREGVEVREWLFLHGT